MFSSKDLFFTPAASGAYTVSKSLRFREASTTYLNRTPGGAGSQTTWTWSAWVKRGRLTYAGSGGITTLFGWQGTVSGQSGAICFTTTSFTGAGDNLAFFQGANNYRVTNAVLRDPSAWYHIVAVWDSNNGIDAQRCRLYVNGVEASYATSNTITSGTTLNCNNTVAHAIGADITNNTNVVRNYFDGYMADVNFIGGSALTPSSFGEYDTNGVWQPKAYTGSYSGTNSFYLKFTTVGATSGSNTGYGQDFSGNGNYWTTNNFGTTSTDTTYDSMLDSPTNAAGDIGNYCVLNPLFTNQTGVASGATGTAPTISNANLTTTAAAGSAQTSSIGSLGVSSGKWYFEYTPSAVNSTGDIVGFVTTFDGTLKVAGYRSTGIIYTNGSTTSGYATWTSSNVIGIALDIDGSTVSCYKDNALQATLSLTNAITTFCYPLVWFRDASGAGAINFGQRPFAYTPPSGYSALNTQNLSTPTITNGAQYMAASTWTGNGSSTLTITNGGNNNAGTTFQPDLVWAKLRSGAASHNLYDSVRGAGKVLYSDLTDVEATNNIYGYLNSFNSNGFGATAGSTSIAYFNANSSTYVAWQWKGGGAGVVNNVGTIQSNVSANTTAGFSIVTAQSTGTTGSASVGHGLGVTPSMVIFKNRDIADDWYTWHTSLGSSTAGNYIRLNTTAAATSSANIWGGTGYGMTSTTLGLNQSAFFSASNQKFVFYAFAAVASYSSFGSYTGNGSTDGVFVYTGFRPRYVLLKSSSGAYNWQIFDTSRGTYNINNPVLDANTANAEVNVSAYGIDVLSNGFKLRTNDATVNLSSGTYIYAAFAENPFKISRAR